MLPPAGPVRIAVLGAARIAPGALVEPARAVAEAEVIGVAARNPARAGDFQMRHGLVKAYPSYDALLADEEVEAVYNPLPNGLHCEWTCRALEAGKHVLCEKPLAANSAEAEKMVEVAAQSERHLMEAFHYRYHPLAARMRQIIDEGELGDIRHVEAHVCFPLPVFSDIRYRYDLAGGATMDAGCYAIHMVRFLAGEEPTVKRAEARLRDPKIDRYMEADFEFPSGTTGHMSCSMFSTRLLRIQSRVIGTDGEMSAFNPVLPHVFHRLSVRSKRGRRSERISGDPSYTHQLRAFVDLVRNGTPVPTGPDDALANMRAIDRVYDAAGLPLRGLPELPPG